MSEKPKETLSFEYKISPNYATYKITGIYGGFNAFGDFVASFFNERPAIAKTETYELKNGELSASPISQEKKTCIIRDVMFAVSMSPNIARILGKYFIEKADEFDEKIKAASK